MNLAVHIGPVPAAQHCTTLPLQVRFLYLDNKQLASLRHNPQLPKDLLLAGSLMRLEAMDCCGSSAGEGLKPPPRPTYCCDDKYGLPGGSTTLTVQLEDIWEHVSGAGAPVGAGLVGAGCQHVMSMGALLRSCGHYDWACRGVTHKSVQVGRCP